MGVHFDERRDPTAIKVAVVFDHLGPYHLARLRAAARKVSLLAVEFGGRSADYAWNVLKAAEPFCRVTLFPGGTSRERSRAQYQQLLNKHLSNFAPDAVAIPGWSSLGAIVAMGWCQRAGIPAVVMSDSTEDDEPRVRWKEWVKRRFLGNCSAALAAGIRHKEYLEILGVPVSRIFLGYDAVDNDYFARECEKVQKVKSAIGGNVCSEPSPPSCLSPENAFYFLASARFIEKKNLPFLLRAYARYRELTEAAESEEGKVKIWDLVILGDGPLRATLNQQLSTLNLHSYVHLPGFVQYEELPSYYARAGAFIQASTSEQWGLVVNEAMASRLPVLVSDRCGCAPDLVQEGLNGWKFDPTNEEELVSLLCRVAGMSHEARHQMGFKSQEIIAAWGPERFANGLLAAAECATRVGARRAGLIDRTLLWALAMQ